jgi:hypothetical protein
MGAFLIAVRYRRFTSEMIRAFVELDPKLLQIVDHFPRFAFQDVLQFLALIVFSGVNLSAKLFLNLTRNSIKLTPKLLHIVHHSSQFVFRDASKFFARSVFGGAQLSVNLFLNLTRNLIELTPKLLHVVHHYLR